MPPKIPKKIRAVTLPDNGVGKIRADLYKQAYERMKEAAEKGFYLEVITLIESLISDRVESFITKSTGEDFSFKTLGELIDKTRTLNEDDKLKNLVIVELNQ